MTNTSTYRSCPVRAASRGVGQSLVLLAAMAMVLAGPVHLWLAHGHGHECSQAEPTVEFVFVGCQHHDHCGGSHGHNEAPAPAQEDDHTPCQDHSGECETCMALATFVPLQMCSVFTIAEEEFLEVAHVVQDAPYIDWRGAAITSRGPPAQL